MDELVKTFNEQLVSEEQSQNSNFKDLYKNNGRLDNQEQRRKELLAEQKLGRQRQLDNVRGILDLVDKYDNDVFKYDARDNRRAYYRPTLYVAGFSKSSYRNILMMSEWIIEKPGDFNENWYITPCPKGVRVLVIACQGWTKFYSKYGRYQFQMKTALPGGCSRGKRSTCTVLDGFYYEKENIFFILDVLAWNNQAMTDCEAEFRVFWMNNQMIERPELKTLSKSNEVIFSLLPKEPCSPNNLNAFLMQPSPFTDPNIELSESILDGFLFYHKRAHYVSGETPLVGWLFPYMIQEVLGSDITLNPVYDAMKPSDYVNQAVFIEKFAEEQEKKKKRREKRTNRGQHYSQNRHSETDSQQGNDDDNYDEMDADDTDKVEADSQKMEAEVSRKIENELAQKMEAEVPQNEVKMPQTKNAEVTQKMEAENTKNQANESMESEQVSQETTQADS